MAEMLGSTTKPTFTLDVLKNGERLVPDTDLLSNFTSMQFLVSISGKPETAAITAIGSTAIVTMAAQRTNLEYVLGAVIAIQLARELNESISDEWCFYGGQPVEKSAEALYDYLKVPDEGLELREAADQLADRIGNPSLKEIGANRGLLRTEEN